MASEKMDAEVITKLMVALTLVLLAWAYFSADRSARAQMAQKIALNEGRINALKSELSQSENIRQVLIKQVTEYRKDVEEVQEHCARLRAGQQKLQLKHEFLRGRVSALPQKTVSFDPVPPVPAKVKSQLKQTAEQVRNF